MCPDHDDRTDDLDRRRFLAATAGTAGLVGGIGVASAIGAREAALADTDPLTSDRSDRSLAGTANDSERTRPSGTFTAVVDRFEGDRAVLVLERNGETAGEFVTDAGTLPDDGRHVDAVLEVTLREGELVAVEDRPAETEARGERAQRRFDRLSRRPPRDGTRRETSVCPAPGRGNRGRGDPSWWLPGPRDDEPAPACDRRSRPRSPD